MPPRKPLAKASQDENDPKKRREIILKLIRDHGVISKFEHLFKDLTDIATTLPSSANIAVEVVEKLMLSQSSRNPKKKGENIKISENGKNNFEDLKKITSEDYRRKAPKADEAVNIRETNRIMKEILTVALQEILPSTSVPTSPSVEPIKPDNQLRITMSDSDSWRGDISYRGSFNEAGEPEGQGSMLFQYGLPNAYRGSFSTIQWKRRILRMPEPEGYDLVFYEQFKEVSSKIRAILDQEKQLGSSYQQSIEGACSELAILLNESNDEYWKFLDKELSAIKPQALRGSLSDFLESLKEPIDYTLSDCLKDFLKFAAYAKDNVLSELIKALERKLDLDKAAKQKEVVDILAKYSEYIELTKTLMNEEDGKKLKTALNVAVGFYLNFRIDITNFRDDIDIVSPYLIFQKINDEFALGKVYNGLPDIFAGTGIESDADIMAILNNFREKISDLYTKSNPKAPEDKKEKIVGKIIIMILEEISLESKRLLHEVEALKPVFFYDGTYRGNVVDGKPSGEGEFTYLDGSYFKGNFVDGKPSGEGLLLFQDGARCKGSFASDKWQEILDLKRFDDFYKKFNEATMDIQLFDFAKILDNILVAMSLSDSGDELQKNGRKLFIDELQKKLEVCQKGDKVLIVFNSLLAFVKSNNSLLEIDEITKDTDPESRNIAFDALITELRKGCSLASENIENAVHKNNLFDQEMIDEIYFKLIPLFDFRNLRSWEILFEKTSEVGVPLAVKESLDDFLTFAEDIKSETLVELIKNFEMLSLKPMELPEHPPSQSQPNTGVSNISATETLFVSEHSPNQSK